VSRVREHSVWVYRERVHGSKSQGQVEVTSVFKAGSETEKKSEVRANCEDEIGTVKVVI
jgi:hypothetical protein